MAINEAFPWDEKDSVLPQSYRQYMLLVSLSEWNDTKVLFCEEKYYFL